MSNLVPASLELNEQIVKSFNDAEYLNTAITNINTYFENHGYDTTKYPSFSSGGSLDDWFYRAVWEFLLSTSKAKLIGELNTSEYAPESLDLNKAIELIKLLRSSGMVDATYEEHNRTIQWYTIPEIARVQPDNNFYLRINDIVGLEMPEDKYTTEFSQEFFDNSGFNSNVSTIKNDVLNQANAGKAAKDISVVMSYIDEASNLPYLEYFKESGFKDAYFNVIPGDASDTYIMYFYK